MIRLLAFAAKDGWAFINNLGRILLVRPPYVSENLQPVDQDTVSRAVLFNGFEIADSEFQDWTELIRFLNLTVAKSRATEAPLPSDRDLRRRLLEFAPADILKGFIGRVEAELIPSHAWDEAKDLLLDILSLPSVQADAELVNGAMAGLNKVMNAQQNQRESFNSLLSYSLQNNCRLAVQRYGREELGIYAKSVAQQGQLLRLF